MSFLVALGAALLLTPAAIWAGRVLGVVDRPGDRLKIHRSPVPVLGGVAVLVATVGGVTAAGRPLSVGVAAGVALVLLAGLADDIRPLPPWLRFALQAAAGVLVVWGGLRLTPLGPLGGAAVVFLVLACANAVNIMDGQDGLAGGLGAIAALGMAMLCLLFEDPAGAALGLAVAGSLSGFLVWNRPPARIFLGNGGAYCVGALLAVLAVRVGASGGWSGVLAAGTCLGVFAIELTLTVARRMRAAHPLATGDRLHSYDVLGRGAARESVTLAFWGVGGVAAVAGLVVGSVPVAVTAPAIALAAVTSLWWVARLSAARRHPAGG